MTNSELLYLLSFEPSLESVEILKQEELEHDATFVVAKLQAKLHYPEQVVETEMTVPFVHYTGQDWIFTPWDWDDGALATTPEEIPETKWRVDDTEIEAIMFCGLPMLAPWVPEEPNPQRATRKRIGQQLQDAREEKGISIRALAEQTGLNKSQICRIEAGRLNTGIDAISKLADALGLRLNLDEV